MAQITFTTNNDPLGGPNSGSGTDQGSLWNYVLSSLNTMFTEIYALVGSGGAAVLASITGSAATFPITGLSAAQGGTATVTGGTSSTSGNAGGAAGLVGGVPGATGAGGAANVAGGAGGSSSGAGGVASLIGGAGTAGNANGGKAQVAGGLGQGSGVAGTSQLGRATGLSALALGVSRSTIADAGTITDAQIRSMVLFQDASGGAVTMATRTAAQMDSAFPDLATGQAIPLWVASNHATNTSTLSGGANVTLVGSGAVTQLGGSFLLIKTGTATYDLVRVG